MLVLRGTTNGSWRKVSTNNSGRDQLLVFIIVRPRGRGLLAGVCNIVEISLHVYEIMPSVWKIGIECKMQQIWVWRILISVLWNLTAYVFLSYVRDIGLKFVTYWYQLFTRCEELVPILHGVKSTKCEIYGSKKHAYTLLPSSLANCNASLIKKKYTCECLPFNELLLSNCLHQPIKTFAHMTNVV